jgi:hypothetical protein
MRSRSWQNYFFAFVIVIALGIIANAELRVLLLFVDAIGLELVVLLFVIQIRLLFSSIVASATVAESFFEAVKRRSLSASPPFVAYRPLALCPLFWLFSYGKHLVRGRRISSKDIRAS